MVNGAMRGVKYINAGIVQNGEFTTKNGVYADGSARTSSLQGRSYYIDYLTDPRSTPPWYDSRSGYKGLWSGSTGAPGTVTLRISDEPNLPGPDTFFHNGSPIVSENIRADFRDYVLVSTTAAANGSESVYDDLGEGAWTFQGSGTFAGVAAANNIENGTGTWTGYSWDGDSGDSALGRVTQNTPAPITSGTPCNDMFSSETFS
jgi:hypothetical protein